MEKKEYYKTKAFKMLKEKCLERDSYKCVCCDRTENLVCHHRNYSHFGQGDDEELNDCVTLCKYCHRAIHSYKPNYSWFSEKNDRNKIVISS